jgi:hypothetical protein
MAIDRLLADPRRLADAVDRGALIAVRQEFPPADIQQVVDAARLPVVGVSDGLLRGSDSRKSCLASRAMLSLTHPCSKGLIYGLIQIKRYDTVCFCFDDQEP